MTQGYGLKLATLVFCLLHFTPPIYSATLSSYLVSSFTPPDADSDLPFNHITINNYITGDVYIGARERLYQLNTALTLKHTVDTGSCRSPNEDNTNNNRLLAVAPSPEDKLITCGGCDGFCETRSLTNISHDVVRHDSSGTQYVVTTSDTPIVGAVLLGADYQEDGVGTADERLYLFTGISDASLTFRSISKHNLFDLKNEQHVTQPLSSAPQIIFKYLIAYRENLFYFMFRGNIQNNAHLGRLCRNSLDEQLASYTEIQLQCGSHNEIQSGHIGAAGSQLADSFSMESTDDLLYAVFGSESSSALCIYKMSDVEQSIDDAAKGCSRSGDTRGTESNYLQDSTCNSVSVNIEPPDAVLCTAFQIEDGSTTRYYQYASGVNPLSPSLIIPLGAASPTSIVTTIERQHTLAIIGDTQGNLQKVNIVNSTFGYVYETVPLGSGSVLRELFLDESTEQLTLATTSDQGSQVLKLNLANCGQYQTCDECIGGNGGNDGDPYCGWCTLEKRCTRYEACDLPEQPSRWLSYNALQCVSISDVQPDNLPYDVTDQQITITVQQLPRLTDSFQYRCAFGTYEVDAATSGDTLTCTSPPANEVPPIPAGSYFVSVDLSIVSTETKVKFVATDFSFFGCSLIKSCSACVTVDFPCDWCVYDNKCTDDSSSECQAGDTVIIGDNNHVGSGNRGQEFCPQLLGATESFLIPVNIPSRFSLSAKNLPTDPSQGLQRYECILDIEGEEVRVASAEFTETYILCNDKEYIYDENAIQKNISVSVKWNGQNTIDDHSDSFVTLYKCSINGGSCSRCLSQEATPSVLNCGWCGDDCNVIQSDVCQNNGFLHQNETQQCPSPVITKFNPMSGPIGGRTRLEVIGTDIGVVFEDVLQIHIQDLECDKTDMDEYYQAGQSVSCMTSISTEVLSEPIGITVMSGNGNKTGQSTQDFQYRDPALTGFYPIEGPVAGGTEVTIIGENLDTGRDITARFGDADCKVINVERTSAICMTSEITENNQVSVTLTMVFDGVEREFNGYQFSYMPNPRIDDIDTTATIMAGGLDIILTGDRFDLIQEPLIEVTSLATSASNSELCNGTATILICPTPSFPDNDSSSTRKRRAPDSMTANLTFDFDGYIIDGGTIEYFPDPVYYSFSADGAIYSSKNQRLEINGMNLDLASTEDDVQVFLGPDGECNVDFLKVDILGCQLPETQPQPGYLNGTQGAGGTRNLPAVTILHGNLVFHPGFVSAWASNNNSQLAAIISIAVVGIIVTITLMVIVLIWLRKKQRLAQRAKEEVEMVRSNILKRIQEVSNTSLDLSGADDRVQKHGVPFRGHVDYVTMMLFKGLGVHPETTDPEYMEDFMEHSVISFYRMLKKKDNLMDFIRQLERKKEHHGREREIIASLLAISLISEGMAIHFTDVLLSLVEDEIRKASESRRRMDALFINTETITERLLSSWFALVMFSYMETYTFYPLYMLYQAIKTQTEKGPIDEGTGEAYYTLEYSKLFDQIIQFHSLALDVVDEDGHIYLHVSALDVDTVKQVKKKVLDSMWREGYCLLPRDVDAVDVVWVQGNGQSVLLQETSEGQGKTIANTITSYGIRNGDCVALIPKQYGQASMIDEYQTLDLKEVSSDKYESLLLPTSVDVLGAQLTQEGSNVIHLKDLEEQAKMKESAMPHHIQQKRENLDRNLAIPHMLTMKAAISPCVDGVFEVMFKKPDIVPLPIKHLFDTFDDLAVKYTEGVHPEVKSEKWKKNCLSNFWCSVLTNLPSLFEMPRSETADRCVDILADALGHVTKSMSLQTQEEPDQLPYYKEYPLYRQMLTSFCNEIANQPRASPGKVNKACSNVSKEFKGQFSNLSNMMHLYNCTKSDVENLLK
ncbi:plexin-B1-like [Lytechinus pictus]|uniref:plexin-B1-like n=1 Tax=Lytechinus pictus TaxID=7653 RepID=UPI0030BA1A49